MSKELTTEKVTLTLAYTDDPPMKALIDAFEAKHPNITIKGQQTPFSDYVKSIKLAMASSTPPDIAEYNPGAMRSLVPGGADLRPHAVREAVRLAATGSRRRASRCCARTRTAKEYGTGGLYAVPGALSVLGVFYNK